MPVCHARDMGILSDFVLASEDELRNALFAWRKVAPKPRRVRQRRVNPFTKEPIEVDAVVWTADPSEADPINKIDLDSIPLPDAVAKALARFPDTDGRILAANKLSVLDQRGLSLLPQVNFKRITTLELQSLALVVVGDDSLSEEVERPALLPPVVAEGERWVHKIPERLVSAIASLDDANLQATAAAWAKEMECATDDAHHVLSGLRTLCFQAVSTSKRVFLHGSL
jgi:hypothetical protein